MRGRSFFSTIPTLITEVRAASETARFRYPISFFSRIETAPVTSDRVEFPQAKTRFPADRNLLVTSGEERFKWRDQLTFCNYHSRSMDSNHSADTRSRTNLQLTVAVGIRIQLGKLISIVQRKTTPTIYILLDIMQDGTIIMQPSARQPLREDSRIN
jgi:hypothetical protein